MRSSGLDTTCLDVVFSRNVQNLPFRSLKAIFFRRIPRGPRRLACPFRGASAESINPFFLGLSAVCTLYSFWSTFELTIQNTTIPQVRNLFSVIAVFISFSPWRAAAAAALAADFCCCCTRPHPTYLRVCTARIPPCTETPLPPQHHHIIPSAYCPCMGTTLTP